MNARFDCPGKYADEMSLTLGGRELADRLADSSPIALSRVDLRLVRRCANGDLVIHRESQPGNAGRPPLHS